MESIKKLREMCKYRHLVVNTSMTSDGTTVANLGSPLVEMIDDIIGNIEVEIAANYLELPKDADGVPIHVWDELECHANGYDGVFTVFAIGDDVVVGNYDIEWVGRNPTKWFHVASFCTHVKPRTLEDVLVEYAETIDVTSWKKAHDNRSLTVGEWEEIVRSEAEKYAAEIRELLGGDE